MTFTIKRNLNGAIPYSWMLIQAGKGILFAATVQVLIDLLIDFGYGQCFIEVIP